MYAMGSDGMLHTLGASNGADQVPPVAFLPPSARPSALIWVDGMVYTSTSNECGAAPNAVWAIDLTTSEHETGCLENRRGERRRHERTHAWNHRRSLCRAERQSAAGRYERIDSRHSGRGCGGRARRPYASRQGLVQRGGGRLQHVADRHPREGSGPDRGGRERWPVVLAGRKVGRRQRSQDAALRDAEVHRRRRRRRARHLGRATAHAGFSRPPSAPFRAARDRRRTA